MSETPRMGLPLMQAAQAQKHVTHNEALVVVDALAHLYLLDRDLAAPPPSPVDGDAYLVASGASGDWAGQDGKIAYLIDAAWRFHAPFKGLRALIEDEPALLHYDGAAWVDFSTLLSLQNVPLLGVGTTADATNPFSAKLNNALLTAKYAAEAGDGSLRIKANKEAVGNTAAYLFQTDYSGRAEFGLIGNDDFTIKVSPDGSAWVDALRIDKTTGEVRHAQNEYGATTAPGINDDGAAGYAVGSRWFDETADKEYVCLDNTTGAAVWVETTASGGGGGGGEANTASNVGTAGVGLFKVKSGVDLQFKKLNAGSAKITITDDVGNDEVDIDVDIDPDDLDDSSTTNQFTTAADIAKLAGIEAGATADQTGAEIKAAYEAEADTNAFSDAEKTKVGHLTVTQAVDLDTIESRVNALDAAVVLMGSWDAASGSFPGGGSAQAGESWIVSVGGTVDGVAFNANDRLVAITDNASSATYASNWLKLDYTDQVLSVNGQTGAVALDPDDLDDSATTNKFTAAADIAKLAGIEAGATADQSAADIRGLGFFDTSNDGAGSGLDADLLDGNQASAFATAAQGAAADTALQDVVDDTTPQLGGDIDLNGKAISEIRTAGEVLSAGDWCYLKSDGKMWKADASAEATAGGLLAMAGAAISADATGKFLLFGKWTATGLTAGATYYLSETAGAIASTAPSTSGAIVRIVGYAESTTVLNIRIDGTYLEIA